MLKIDKILESKYGNMETFSLVIDEVTAEEANIFRRSMTTEVDCYATKMINLISNESSLRTPEIAHRIGLIPISNEQLDKNFRNESNNMYKCELNITNTSSSNYDVFSNSIELLDLSDHGTGIYPYASDFKITQLKPGQSLNMFLFIDKNNGIENIRYRPCKCQKFKETESGFNIEFLNFGILKTNKIIEKAIESCKKYGLVISKNI